MLKFRHINTLTIFDWILIIGVIAANLIYSILEESADIVGSAAGISGVICVVMVARGNIMNYLFGVINVSLYAYISFKAGLYGDAALNALYYFPMQFIGWFSWVKKREEAESVTVVARRMSRSQRVWLSLACVILTAVVAWILHISGDPQPVKDSATTVLSVIAMFLMVRRFMEQWTLWVAVNIISIVMWSIALINGQSHSALMVIMWVFYLANSVNGWITWVKLSKSRE
jgi:nicotinamide mononucleotide transporter